MEHNRHSHGYDDFDWEGYGSKIIEWQLGHIEADKDLHYRFRILAVELSFNLQSTRSSAGGDHGGENDQSLIAQLRPGAKP